MTPSPRPVLLSGSQPTGNLTIGNYAGAIHQWVRMQREHDCFFVLVDLHAITVPNDPEELRRRCYEFLSLFLACGIDPASCTILVQSHVPQHAQLAWVLDCIAPFGRLTRMTQFKEKADQHSDAVNAGLFTYPVLMAADILLYQTNLVPVGEDQRQHLELTRDLAQRFNGQYGQTFTIPEGFTPKLGARIRSLLDPSAKMSKTDPQPENCIALLDEPDAVGRKIRRAVTDPGKEVVYDASKPGVSNLLELYTVVSGQGLSAVQARFVGKGYADLKKELAEATVEFLRPIQHRYKDIAQDRTGLSGILREGAERAKAKAQLTWAKVQQAIGFIVP